MPRFTFLISKIPDEPHGGQYVIDPQTGEVVSMTFLFGVDLEFQEDLDNENGSLSADLREEFYHNNISLSQNITVSVKKSDTEWLISDNKTGHTYAVRREGDKLNIYHVKGELQ